MIEMTPVALLLLLTCTVDLTSGEEGQNNNNSSSTDTREQVHETSLATIAYLIVGLITLILLASGITYLSLKLSIGSASPLSDSQEESGSERKAPAAAAVQQEQPRGSIATVYPYLPPLGPPLPSTYTAEEPPSHHSKSTAPSSSSSRASAKTRRPSSPNHPTPIAAAGSERTSGGGGSSPVSRTTAKTA